MTALYEIIPTGVDSEFTKVDDLKYQKSKNTESTSHDKEVMTVKFRYKKPDVEVSKLIVHPLMDENISINKTSDNFRWSASVAAVGMLLRESEYVKEFALTDALQLAQGSRGSDVNGYRIEFINMVIISHVTTCQLSKELTSGKSPQNETFCGFFILNFIFG